MKYIDADRLRVEIEKRLKNVRDYMNGAGMKYKGPKYYKAQGKESAYDALLSIIESLQQEQPEHSKSKFVFPNFLYARTVDNKTIDVSYAPQSLDAVEYVKNNPTEQPVEGLDVTDFCKPIDPDIEQCVADHFWEMIGEESTNKKPVEELEEEYLRFVRSDHHQLQSLFGKAGIDIARHFAEWGAEHLKK